VITLLDRGAPAPASAGPADPSSHPDPVLLELWSQRFMSIAEQMGVVLQRTALSTNIRERLDFSCAVFDREGGLVANAPHIPVHLGAIGESIRALVELHPRMRPGDVYATNDPALGGSHLPDVTVVTPIFDSRGELAFFTANRGHHADIGGITPGSMPPFSTQLGEEGIVISGLRIVADGRLDEALLRRVLGTGSHPARAPEQNLADLQAQIAANRRGEQLLHDLLARHGLAVTEAYMRHVQDNGEACVRDAITALPDGEHAFADAMDDGTRIAVRITVAADRMRVDFTGSSPQVHGNLNAPRAVTVAAVLYVLRTLVGRPIPLNSGCLRPISLVVPRGSVLWPAPGAAVVAGNVETSQRAVDVLLGALGKLAACQGTMNNLALGDDTFGYYETIAGGAGASAQRDGASGVHTHMTNTRITDPEVLEAAFPLRLLRFAYRRGSGGAGRRRGGDGLVRELLALAPLRASILSERRVTEPFGLHGGAPGARGRNFLNDEPIGGRAQLELARFDRLRIETPGGGGHGSPDGSAGF
jgi:5-oxoprolinase (ATP-hydrolysing)